MKNIILGLAIAAVVILLAMKLVQPSIEGRWIAEYVIDNESDTLRIDASRIQLHIKDDGYTFDSTLNQKEKGSIHRKGSDLTLLNDQGQSYKIRIADLSKSQLIILMKANNTGRKMIMHRSNYIK